MIERDNSQRSTFIKSWQEKTPVRKSIAQVLETLLDKEKQPRLARAGFIDIFKTEEVSQAFHQLQNNPALPLVLMDIGGGKVLDHAMRKNPVIVDVVRYPNVRLIDSLKFIAEVFTVYDKPRTQLFSQELALEGIRRIQSSIRHDLRHALTGHRGYDKGGLIRRARAELNLQGTDEEVVAAVMEESKMIQPAQYLNINGLFVDWEGTLAKDDVLSPERLTGFQTKAQEQNLPLAIWTGGNVNRVYNQLHRAGIYSLDVCSKQDCFGLKVKMAVDDQDLEKLKGEYGFDVEKFEKV